MIQMVFKNHALSTKTLHLLKILASPKSMWSHHYLAPHSSRLKGIFNSQYSGLTVPRIWSLSCGVGINVRRFCSEGSGELEKGLVVSNVADAITSENNVVADKGLVVSNVADAVTSENNVVADKGLVVSNVADAVTSENNVVADKGLVVSNVADAVTSENNVVADKGLVVSNVADAVTSENNVVADKGLVVSNVADAITSENNVVADKVVKIVKDHSRHEHKMEDALEQSGIELTTPLVMEVLERLHYEETVALRFFMWALYQDNYTHETCAYNVIIDTLTSNTYKVKQFRIVCDLLDYMKRNKKRLVPTDALLVILKRYSEKNLTHLKEINEEMSERKKRRRRRIQLEIRAFNLLIDGLCKCSLVELAEAMFRRVQSEVKPTHETYSILFFGWCQVRNPRRGMLLLEEMAALGFDPESSAYNTAISTFCKCGLITEASELLTFMKNRGSRYSSPTARSYFIMIVALVENDRMEQGFELLREMITTGCLPDVATYQELIEGMCLNGKIEAAYRVLEEMSRTSYPPDIVTYNCFLKVLCDNKESDEVLRLYKKMIEVGCVPSVQTYNMMIEMYYRIGDIEGVSDTWHEMDKRGCMRNLDTACVMIEGLFNNNNAKDACSLLEEVISMGVRLPYENYQTILMQLSKIGHLQLIHRLSAHMRKFENPRLVRRHALKQNRYRRPSGEK